jgi:hypothetical protein
VRHVLVTVSLIQEARAADAKAAPGQLVDAPAEAPFATNRRRRRVTTLVRRARVRVVRPT